MTWKEAMRLRKAIAQNQLESWRLRLSPIAYRDQNITVARIVHLWYMTWLTGVAS